MSSDVLIRLTECQSIPFAKRGDTRFRIVCAGRRWGKTIWEASETTIEAIEKRRDGEYWYVGPTYKAAKRIAWPVFKRIIPPGIIEGRPNESELTIRLVNGSLIRLVGADDPDSLRGSALAWAAMDEYADMKWTVWDEIIRPALSDNQGHAIFGGTPKGFNHFYDLFMESQYRSDWEAWQFTTLEGGNVPAKELDEAKRTTDPRIFAQEYEASFENLEGRIYTGFSYEDSVRDDLVDLGGELLVGMDFNVSPMYSCIAQCAGDEIHFLEEIALNDSNTTEMCQEIVRRAVEVYGFADGRPRYTVCYPDPTGRKRQTNAAVGVTDFNIIRDHGLDMIAPSRTYPVNDRINTVNGLLFGADGSRHIFLHPNCKHLIKGLAGQTWREGTKIPDKTLGLDHAVDAAGYLVCGVKGLLGAGKAGSLRMTI